MLSIVFSANEAITATVVPMRKEPIKITPKTIAECEIIYQLDPESEIYSIVLYSTMVTASLNMLSPKIKLKSLLLVPKSFIIAKTETGSVAEINVPKAKLSAKLKDSTSSNNAPMMYIRDPINIVDIKVPNNAYIVIAPKFAKKGFFSRL